MVVIISRIKDFLAQAFARGACREWLLRRKGQNFGLGTALALSLFLVGSCNNANIGLFSFSGKTADLSAMNKGQMMRYAHHWLILLGRYICKARKPDCAACPVRTVCEYKEKTPRANSV